MTVRTIEFEVKLSERRLASDLPGFLDMLRYEQGTVVSWGHEALGGTYGDWFTVRLRVPALQHVPRRWESFGIYPKEVVK